MKITPTKLEGVFVIENNSFVDERGSFTKTFHKDLFEEQGISCDFRESFYSISKKDVMRGMHFHLPPKDHAKLVYVTSGKALDVTLDIRKNSKTYGEYLVAELSHENNTMVYIPRGFAHGFLSMEDDTCMVYLQSGVYSSEHDAGIRIDSFGLDLGIQNPLLSKRDQNFPAFSDFDSPF